MSLLQFYSNALTAIVRLLGSSVEGPHNAVLYGGEGPVGSTDADDADDAEGEAVADAPGFFGPGVVWRPRPPEDVGGGESVGAEAVGFRLPDGLVPVGARDLRANRAFPAPKAGTWAVVHYGGGFLSFEDVTEGDTGQTGTVQTLYCPYEGGAKAHAIVLDPDEEAVSVIHADGYAVVMTADGIVLRGGTETFIQITSDTIRLVAPNIIAQGIVALGAQPASASPVLAGIASLPSPSVFLSLT